MILTATQPYEQLGLFYLGKRFDLESNTRMDEPVLYDSRRLTTHAVCVGMTGSGKTGVGIGIIEEAALGGIPVLAIDPKGDLANLLLTFPGLTAAEFQPWVSKNESASGPAEAWRAGLAEWDQDGQRIERLRATGRARIYTPGSRAGAPLALLRSGHPQRRVLLRVLSSACRRFSARIVRIKSTLIATSASSRPPR